MHHSPVCPEENNPQSKGSPGVVTDDETLVRYILPPSHVGEDHLISADFVTVQHLKDGCSFDRCDHRAAAHQQGGAHAQKFSKQYIGHCSVNVGMVRSLKRQDRQQAFCVIDDAIQGNANHALVQFSDTNQPPSKLRALRYNLQKMLNIHLL